MRTVYIADDGTEFDNELDCESYEYELNVKNNTIIMFNEEGELLDSSNYMNIENCYYIKIKTNNDLEILQKIYEYTGFIVPNEIGEFYYDDSDRFDNLWHSIDDRIKELNKLKNIKEKMNEYSNKKS